MKKLNPKLLSQSIAILLMCSTSLIAFVEVVVLKVSTIIAMDDKSPVLLIEAKMTDVQSNQLLGEDLFAIWGESFKTLGGSLDSFIAMVRTIVNVAMVYFADQKPVPTKQ